MRKILLTGAGGFIGKNIYEQLSSRYTILAPSSAQLNLLDQQAVSRYLYENEITDVIHAAVYNQKRRDIQPELDLSANLKMFYHLVEHSSELNKIIYFGSGAEYDKRYPMHLIQEEDFGRSIPLLNDYGLSKYIMNLEARRSKNIYNLRLFGIYGKYENWQTCFPSHLCLQALRGETLTIRQDCLFDFMYIDDLMEPLCWVLENEPKYQDYNVCTGQPIWLSEIAEMVKAICGRSLSNECLSSGCNLEYTGSNERMIKEHYCKSTDVFKGLKYLYDYYVRMNKIRAGG